MRPPGCGTFIGALEVRRALQSMRVQSIPLQEQVKVLHVMAEACCAVQVAEVAFAS